MPEDKRTLKLETITESFIAVYTCCKLQCNAYIDTLKFKNKALSTIEKRI